MNRFKKLSFIKLNSFKGISSSLVSTGIQILIQILMVPVFLESWGVEFYGDWIALTAMFSLLSLFDFSFGVVIANECTRLISIKDNLKNNLVKVANTYLSIFAILLFLIVSIFVLFVKRNSMHFPFDKFKADVVIGVVFYSILSIFSSIPSGLYRTFSRFARWVNLTTIYRILEAVSSAVVLKCGGDVDYLLLILIVMRVIYSVILLIDIKRISNLSFFSFAELKNYHILSSIIKSGVGLFSNNVFQTFFTAILPSLLNNYFGSIFLVQFNTIRTLLNSLKSVSLVICGAVWGELNTLYYKDDLPKLNELIKKYEKLIIFLILFFSIFLSIFGNFIYVKWLGGQIEFNNVLSFLLLLSIIISSKYSVRHTFLLSINRTIGLSINHFLALFVMLVILIIPASLYNLNWTAFSIIAYELIIGIYVYRISNKLLYVNVKI